MILDYWLFREDTKTAFDLGGGGWSRILIVTPEPMTTEPLRLFQAPTNWREMIELLFNKSPKHPSNERYFDELARRLNRFCAPINNGSAPMLWCCTDAGDRDARAFEEEGYRLVGTRYGREAGKWWLDLVDHHPPRDREEARLIAWSASTQSTISWGFEHRHAASYRYHRITEEEIDSDLAKPPAVTPPKKERPMKYQRAVTLIDLIDEPNRTAIRKILADNHELFVRVQGSTHNHQAWPGGYLDHVTEVMNVAVVLFAQLNALRPLPFTLSDILLVVFLHDLEKPWKYEIRDDGQLRYKPKMLSKAEHQRFRMEKLAEYGVQLTPAHENGLQYAEGELSDYSNRERKMEPLAALAHLCDVTSARIWFDHPLAANDPWEGAGRSQ